MKFGRFDLQIKTHRLTESDIWYDVILSRRWPCISKLPSLSSIYPTPFYSPDTHT